eukprot:gnl/MRDRNA2_/MRDRNA2_30341_c0_seq1.p1 gnl/MRDRNA2_/MRDRNA2_30341_c0~~gnl/MRDRNA2_/MRDRNA2_30341_c0_seq1.p1  ORF type:complete len:198 (+),score=38.34 gnl/MRDRNA2_/MRDRNA2_30341_c0_seq1:103-696(+)
MAVAQGSLDGDWVLVDTVRDETPSSDAQSAAGTALLKAVLYSWNEEGLNEDKDTRSEALVAPVQAPVQVVSAPAPVASVHRASPVSIIGERQVVWQTQGFDPSRLVVSEVCPKAQATWDSQQGKKGARVRDLNQIVLADGKVHTYKVYSQATTERAWTPPRARRGRPETANQRKVREGKESGYARRAYLIRGDSLVC